MSKLLPHTQPGGFWLRVGKLTQEEEADFYERTSGCVCYFRGSAPAFGGPQSQIQDRQDRQPQAGTRRGRGPRKAP
jgi:hypothetical protein